MRQAAVTQLGGTHSARGGNGGPTTSQMMRLPIEQLSAGSQVVPPSNGTKATAPKDSRCVLWSRRVKRTSS